MSMQISAGSDLRTRALYLLCALTVFSTAFCLVSYSEFVAATEYPWSSELSRCRQLDAKIEALVAKRRRGGSAAAMDRWKTQLRTAESEYRAMRCHRIPRRYLEERN